MAFSVMNVLAKDLSNFHPMQVVFFRATGTFVLMFPYMLFKRISIIGTHHKQLALRAVLGGISIVCFFVVVQRIPLGSAISLRYLGPIFGAIMAFYWLKEKINFWQWVSFAIAFLGVILIKGFDIRIDYVSFILIMISAVTVGGVFVTIRYLGPREHHLTIINYFMVTCLVMSLFFIGTWRLPIGIEWYSVLSIGVFGLIGQVLMTMAFQTEEASVLAPFKYMELVYVLIVGYFFFGETYTMIPAIGIGCIVLGMVLNLKAKG